VPRRGETSLLRLYSTSNIYIYIMIYIYTVVALVHHSCARRTNQEVYLQTLLRQGKKSETNVCKKNWIQANRAKNPCKLQRPKCIQNFADFRLSNACLHSKTSARQPSQHGDCYAVRPPNQPVNGPTFLTYRYASPVSTNERAPCQKTAVWGMTHA
jgi:hypothetical protein